MLCIVFVLRPILLYLHEYIKLSITNLHVNRKYNHVLSKYKNSELCFTFNIFTLKFSTMYMRILYKIWDLQSKLEQKETSRRKKIYSWMNEKVQLVALYLQVKKAMGKFCHFHNSYTHRYRPNTPHANWYKFFKRK